MTRELVRLLACPVLYVHPADLAQHLDERLGVVRLERVSSFEDDRLAMALGVDPRVLLLHESSV